MAAFAEDKTRKIIPRLRPSRLTAELGELTGFAKRLGTGPPESLLAEKLAEWHGNNTVPLAAEVVGAAIFLGREQEANEAARFIVAAGGRSPALVRELAETIIERKSALINDNPERPGVQVRLLRRRLSDNPRNAIAWADLSREYANLGLAQKASRAMTVAVDLAPDHRFILRSAARLFVHVDDPERAHYLLLRAPSTGFDPWLMAAEIAVAAVSKETSEYAKTGRKLLRSEQFPPWHTSELAGALGTLELEHGNFKEARKLFQKGLLQPTANMVGQARWAQNAVGVQLMDPLALNTLRAFEARAWQEFYKSGWQQSLEETQHWLEDEPYSSRPAVLGSYVAGSILQQYGEAVSIARSGLVANPEHPTLLNNLAFGLINCGELDDAEHNLQKLQKLRSGEIDASVHTLLRATNGLLHFRRGDTENGRRLYLEAIQLAAETRQPLLEARAAVFLALEEVRAKSPFAPEAVKRAFTYSESSSRPDFKLLLSRLG